MNSIYEYGAIERIWDIFLTMGSRETIPALAYNYFKILGVQTELKQEELMVFFIKIAKACSNAHEFEEFITYGKLPHVLKDIPLINYTIVHSPISNLQLTYWIFK